MFEFLTLPPADRACSADPRLESDTSPGHRELPNGVPFGFRPVSCDLQREWPERIETTR